MCFLFIYLHSCKIRWYRSWIVKLSSDSPKKSLLSLLMQCKINPHFSFKYIIIITVFTLFRLVYTPTTDMQVLVGKVYYPGKSASEQTRSIVLPRVRLSKYNTDIALFFRSLHICIFTLLLYIRENSKTQQTSTPVTFTLDSFRFAEDSFCIEAK